MVDEWIEVPVSYLAAESQNALATGPFGSAISSKYFQAHGVPVIRGGNLTTTIDQRLVEEGLAFLSPEKALEFSRSVVRCGDLVFTCWGTIGQVGLIDNRGQYDEYVISNKQMKLTPDARKADSLFLYYVFSSPPVSDDIKSQSIGSSVPGFNLGQLKSIRLRLPPLGTQRAIADVLGVLDDKIEQNRRTALALERLARAIFRAWFADFEPVKAKAAGATAFPAMPQPVFDALPTRFVDSDIGLLPEGWGVKALNEVVQLTMGQSPKSKFYNLNGEGLPFHQGVSDHGFRFPTRRVYCTVEVRIAEAGDILLSVRAPVGRINVADVKMVLGRGLAGMRHFSGRQSFLLYQMQYLFAEDDAIGDGTIYKSVNKEYLHAMPLLTAPRDVEEAFERIARPMDKLISSVVLESRKLAEMRDYLLPKLLGGEARVGDVRYVAGEVAQ